MTTEEKLDKLIELAEKQNKLISHLGLIVARVSTLLIIVLVIIIIEAIINLLF